VVDRVVYFLVDNVHALRRNSFSLAVPSLDRGGVSAPDRSRRASAYVEALDQTAFESKYMTDSFICQEVAVEVTHDLMDFDDDFALGTL
jgi:hypothetical protein